MATSLAQFEERDGHPLDAADLSRTLRQGGFAHVSVDAQPYNASAFIAATRGMPLRLSSGLYPHRTFSFLSTISRCTRTVEEELAGELGALRRQKIMIDDLKATC